MKVVMSLMMLSSATAFSSSRLPLARSVLSRARSSVTMSDTAFDGFSHKVAFCFPGQGAQYVGMCKDVVETVPKAAELFTTASEILG